MKNLKIAPFVFVLFSLFAPMVSADCQAIPPTLDKLEELFGRPVKCYPEGAVCFDSENRRTECPKELENSENSVCFKDRNSAVKADFDANGKIERLTFSDGGAVNSATQLSRKIAPVEKLGNIIKRERHTDEQACLQVYTDHFKCLTITYYDINCTGTTPGATVLSWQR